MYQATLPRIDTCVELYYVAHEQFGTTTFAADELEVEGIDKQDVLELAVAYGLLSFDGSRYQVVCEPDAPAERWRSVAGERADRLKNVVAGHTAQPDSGESSTERTTLTHEGTEYASVTVEESDDFEAVVESVEAAKPETREGIVLRSPGESASSVQRFADQLTELSVQADGPISTELDKEYSDVSGTDKDALEFRLFLRVV